MTHPYTGTRAADPRYRIWFETRPRHLAGRGDPRRITQTLRAAGWKNDSAPDYPHVMLTSPDYRHTLVLEPEVDAYAAWWRVVSRGDGENWHASFGGNTPAEIIAGFTDALIRAAPASEPDVWPLLTAKKWTYERDERGNQCAHHPDGLLRMKRWATLTSDFFSWSAEMVLPTGLGGQHRLWQAYFSDDTPRHLLAGFARALAVDKAVQRGMADVPHTHLVTQEQRGPQGEELAAAHEARLKAVRASVRKARRRGAPSAGAPAPATASSTSARSR